METASYEIKEVDAAEWRRLHEENADLRRQLAEMQEEIEKFEVLGIAAGADDPTSPESILTAILHMQPPE
jgi:hypothetical protein